MNCITSLVSFCILVSLASASSTLDVECGDPKTSTSAVLTYSGDAVSIVAYGKNDPCEFIDNIKTGTRMIEISYNPSDACSFIQEVPGTQSYTLKIESRMLHELFESGNDEKFLVDCNFQSFKSDISVDVDIQEKIKAPEYQLILSGNEASSDFQIYVARAADNTELTGPIKQSAIVNLHTTMTASGGEAAYMPVECTVESKDGTVKVHILASGCGTGFPWKTNEGFTMSGVEGQSPNFRMFRISKMSDLVFKCGFVICDQNCDGSSCVAEEPLRRRRSIAEGLTYNSLGLITSNSTKVRRARVAVSLDENPSDTGVQTVDKSYFSSAYTLILSSSAVLLVILAVGLLCVSLRKRKIIYTIDEEITSM
ncbi:hypothetical protein LOTGIDRAFT_233993 [Lottia gigantea]|uniref:ZP domain-containing protein n=1 Tax=Lottia gigantea TaxID=225164 RepID=V4A4F9_LOTGI|nr:hypothetical protein LOTGIDRAFT_233993 [Lottia gigantea]ESO89840.1 hypothetical protein LOTGIDRAFT_233993 [Lottia gigantea]